MVSFSFSLLWIGGFAFLLVWWTEIAAWHVARRSMRSQGGGGDWGFGLRSPSVRGDDTHRLMYIYIYMYRC